MDFAEMLGDAFTYTREGVLNNGNRWIKLIIAFICLGLPFNGYVMRVYRGTKPAPEVDGWGSLFVDGLKMLIVGIVYAIPLLILWIITYGPFFFTILNGTLNKDALQTWEPNTILLLLFYIVEFAIVLILPVAYIRFARTGTFAEAFNISAVSETIGKIGWIRYIVAVILVSVVVSIPMMILIFGFIFIGVATLFILKDAGLWLFIAFIILAVLLILILVPVFGIFQARYMTRLYDCAFMTEPAH